MKNYLRSIRNWYNMVNNSTPAESRIKTPPANIESESVSTTSTIVETTTIPEEVKLEQPVVEETTTSTTTSTSTKYNKNRLPNFTNKK